MGKNRLIKICSFTLFVISFYAQDLLAQQQNEMKIGDRLVLELGNSVFTQRSLETYLLVKHAVFRNGVYRNISSANWDEARDEFLADMMIDREASRLGSFRVNPEALKRAVDAMDSLVKQDESFKKQIAGLQLTPPRIQQEIGTVLRIEAFKRSKSPDRSVEMADLEFQSNSNIQKQEWFLKIKQSSTYRWYSGASNYVRIQFND